KELKPRGTLGQMACKMIGLPKFNRLLVGPADTGSISQCIAAIQQATRRYAKRQLTWFRRQPSFSVLNLSLLSHNEAVKWIILRMQSERRKVSEVRATG